MNGTYDARRVRRGGITESVQYWSVHRQVWRTAYCQLDVPDRDYSALCEMDRSIPRELPYSLD